ncbi:hypothetical protein HZI30_18805 [Serratia fonticola]|uniref:hypothetical protein n=1 Tax=Serratia fonticola TaxID=47917 RepID=UPI0015C5FD6D|nr:hypothetical protein [Serratia fonticola]NXZ88989.1 hypothetical protein [Serratia fonticola]
MDATHWLNPSAARLLLKTFGKGTVPEYVNKKSYFSTFFTVRFKQPDVPVVGIRHMSRFKPDIGLIQQAWGKNVDFQAYQLVVI